MARPRRRPFYEHEGMQGFSPGEEWLDAYDVNCKMVVQYLQERGAGTTLYYGTIKCFELLRGYLRQTGTAYSAQAATQWLRDTGPCPFGYTIALNRLGDMFEYGEIGPENAYPPTIPWYLSLREEWRCDLDIYLSGLKDLKQATVILIRNTVAHFLFKMQTDGLGSLSEITYENMEAYAACIAPRSEAAVARISNTVGKFLVYLSARGVCSCGLGWYLYLRMRGQILYTSDLTENEADMIEDIRTASQDFPVEEYAALIPDFLERLKDAGYSDSYLGAAKYTLYSLLVFLELHQLGYHAGVATAIWLEHAKDSTGWKVKRRFLELFELYTKVGDVLPEVIFRYTPLLCDGLPAWCHEKLDAFLTLKEKEGLEPSTLCMYRSSITRFCSFIADHGVQSMEEITPAVIKEFNLHDPHMTVEGKNAYNVRIRAFLRYLERAGTISPGISAVLYCTPAPRTQVVVTLSATEKDEIARKNSIASTAEELRDRAMVLLGIRMGLRPSDVVRLKLSDIDWRQQKIRFVQQKTQHEIELPMPTDVGNAIYLYLKKGRYESECPFIFLKIRAPYDAVSRAACQAALRRTLSAPKRPEVSFKILRKTFATDKLQNNVVSSTIADMLGHRGLSAIVHYLNLDTERMYLCPLSLEDLGLQLGVDRYG